DGMSGLGGATGSSTSVLGESPFEDDDPRPGEAGPHGNFDLDDEVSDLPFAGRNDASDEEGAVVAMTNADAGDVDDAADAADAADSRQPAVGPTDAAIRSADRRWTDPNEPATDPTAPTALTARTDTSVPNGRSRRAPRHSCVGSSRVARTCRCTNCAVGSPSTVATTTSPASSSSRAVSTSG